MNSQELFQRACRVTPGGVHSPVRSFKGMDQAPVFFSSAEGPYLQSVEGRQYTDFCLSFGPLLLGHRDPEVAAVVRTMIDKAWTFGACEPYSLELAEWIRERISWVEKIRFVSSGTEAVMSALRVARAATGRNKILKFEGCYHGHADYLLVKSGSGLAGEATTSSAGIPAEAAHQTLVAPLDNEQAVEKVFATYGKDIAAVIIEPLPANYGLLPQRLDFLKFVQKTAQAHGSLFILDEVISGFRVALGGMAEVTGLRPDLVTYGKILGGGFPVGAYAGRADLMDLVAPLGGVYQAGTLSANPIGMCAGLATLQKAVKCNVWPELQKRTETFVEKIRPSLAPLGLDITQQSSLFWIHEPTLSPIRSPDKIPATQGQKFKKLFLRCLEKGIYLAPNAYEVHFLSWAHQASVLDRAATKICEAASELEKSL